MARPRFVRASAAVEAPVPPRVIASVPLHPGVKVCVLPEESMVSVRFVSLEVANVCVDAESPLSEVSPPPAPASALQTNCPVLAL